MINMMGVTRVYSVFGGNPAELIALVDHLGEEHQMLVFPGQYQEGDQVPADVVLNSTPPPFEGESCPNCGCPLDQDEEPEL